MKPVNVALRLANPTHSVVATCVPHVCLAESGPNEQTMSVAWLASQAVTATARIRPLAMLANPAFSPPKKKPEHVDLAELEHTPQKMAPPHAPFVLQGPIKMQVAVPNANCAQLAKH